MQWYYDEDQSFFYPFKLLICKHFGSVVAGSFMTGFFSIFDFLLDFIKPSSSENSYNPGCYARCHKFSCFCCDKLSDLVRSDSMAFINISGNPYCNSSRYCEYLCERSDLTDESQSTSRAYRICAHFLIAGINAIFALYIKGNISLYAMLLIMIITLFISTLFISMHADAAEAIQVILLEDEEFNRREKDDSFGMRQQSAYDSRSLEKNPVVSMRADIANAVFSERRKQVK